LCEPGGICISGKVYEEIKSRFQIRYEDLRSAIRWFCRSARPSRSLNRISPQPPPPSRRQDRYRCLQTQSVTRRAQSLYCALSDAVSLQECRSIVVRLCSPRLLHLRFASGSQ
jgi:hypothetical protein